MRDFQEVFNTKIKLLQQHITDLLKEKADKKIGEITLAHLFKGLRGLPLAYTPTSHVLPHVGVHYRNKPIAEVHSLLPRLKNSTQPSAESLFMYLLTGETPTVEEVERFRVTLHANAFIPNHALTVIDSLPKRSRTMTKYCTGILSCTTSAIYQDMYDDKTIPKSELWKYAYMDSINLFAKIPYIAAYIYRHHCKGLDFIDPDPKLDWVGNLAHMMGYDDLETQDLLRLYIFAHAEHGATNVSAHTSRIVSSSLSNVFYSYGAGMLGLAGPLHGHANEQTIKWILEVIKTAKKNNKKPDDENFITQYIHNCLNNKEVIPGYGHAVLRIEDPRFTIFNNLIDQQNLSSDTIKVMKQLYKLVPYILKVQGKASNTNPNVDAITGVVLHTKGIVEHDFFTVLFGVSRLIGISVQYIIDRTLRMPIERPSTLSDEIFK